MPVFEIETPAGSFEVEAPDEATALKALDGFMPQASSEQEVYVTSGTSRPSALEDVVASGASGVARGAADLIGFPGTIGDVMRSAGQWALRKGYEVATGEAPSPEGDMVERFFAGNPEMERLMIGGGASPLGGQNLKKVASAVTGGATDYQPYTTAGEYSRTVGEFLPDAAAFGGGTVSNLLRNGVVPAVTSETAGQMTEGTALEPFARVAGAVGGSLLANSRLLGARNAEALPTAAEIKQSAGYAGLKEPMKEARLTKDAYQKILRDVWGEAQDFGLTTKLKQQFGGTLRDFAQRVDDGGATLYDLELLRRSLRNAAGDKLDDAAQALSAKLIDRLDESVDALSSANIAARGDAGRPIVDALKDAREVYRTGKKAEIVEEAIRKAQTQASGVENGLRIQFRSILNSPKQRKNFTKDELNAMIQLSSGNFTQNALRWLGTFGVPIDQGRNFLGSLTGGGVGAALGSAVGGPAGASVGGIAIPAIGTAAKFAASRMAQNNADTLEAMIKAGPGAAQRFAEAARQAQAAGREGILRGLLQSQSAAQVPYSREYGRR